MRTSRKPPPRVKQVVEAQDDDSSSDDDWVKALSADEEDKTYSPTVKSELSGVKIKLDVDSCSSANLLDEKNSRCYKTGCLLMPRFYFPSQLQTFLPMVTTRYFWLVLFSKIDKFSNKQGYNS